MKTFFLAFFLSLCFAPALRAEAGPAEAAFDDGVSLLEAGRFAEAGDAFDRCLALLPDTDPDRALVLFQLGLARANEGRPSEAAEAFRRSADADPSVAAPRAFLGNALRLLDRPLEAVDAYLAALRLDPASPRAHDGLWQTYAELSELYGHDRELALRETYHLMRLFELDPDHPKRVPEALEELRYVTGVLRRFDAGVSPEGQRAWRTTAAFTGEALEAGDRASEPPALPDDGVSPEDKLAAYERAKPL